MNWRHFLYMLYPTTRSAMYFLMSRSLILNTCPQAIIVGDRGIEASGTTADVLKHPRNV